MCYHKAVPDDLDTHYLAWKANPSPTTLSQVVQGLQPTIRYSLGAVNAGDDPIVQSKALLYAADAVERYDPLNANGASLPTFVSSHLRQLGRTARMQKMPIKIPEKIQLDAYHLYRKGLEFMEQNNREPDTLELADFSGLPVRRIEKVRRYQMTTPTDGAGVSGAAYDPGYDQEAVAYVHTGSDHLDRRILELKTGYGGHPVTPPAEIGRLLNLTPSQLSRRSMRMAQRISEVENRLQRL